MNYYVKSYLKEDSFSQWKIETIYDIHIILYFVYQKALILELNTSLFNEIIFVNFIL